MRIPLSWLSDYVDLSDLDRDELTHTLAMLGHEVEGVDEIEPGWSNVVIAEVLTVESHPDADKVRVCTVTDGGDPITVVCGAWNFEAGAIVAFARPGAVLPGGFEIGIREIRGVESHGMICSEKELDLGDDADGIMVLEPESPVGRPLESILELPDLVFDLSITPNRPDAMSVFGIARDLAAWYRLNTNLPQPELDESAVPPDVGVEIQDPEGNPRFTLRQIDGVTVGRSPLWMRQRLHRAGIRSISNLVDATNYVMLELGQPLHVFDRDRVEGDVLVVRRAEPGETMTTLDGVSRTLVGSELVICDADGPTSLAGTMGGERSEVDDETTTTLIEGASWDPPTIMHESRRHGLRSEASARFERGVDPQLPPLATARAAELILESAGGKLRGVLDVVARPHTPVQLELEQRQVERVLGDGFDPGRIRDLLNRLGFEVTGKDPMEVVVPSYRPDVRRPIDLVEEVGRLADYGTFGERVTLGSGRGLTPQQVLTRRLIHSLTGTGASQAISLAFVMPQELSAFNPPQDHEMSKTVVVRNPLSEEESVLRPSLLPGLLRAVRHNRGRSRPDVFLFEIGRVFHSAPWNLDARVPDQPLRLGLVMAGSVKPTRLGSEGSLADATTMFGLLRHLGMSLGVDVDLATGAQPGYHPTRTAVVQAGGSPVGFAGELHPVTAGAFELEGRIAVAELDIDILLKGRSEPSYKPVSAYPPADFDLSFEVPGTASAAELIDVVAEAGGTVVESVELFDEFRGGNLPDDRKALAMRVRLRASDRTLDAEEIGATRRSMVEAASRIDATLRGAS